MPLTLSGLTEGWTAVSSYLGIRWQNRRYLVVPLADAPSRSSSRVT
jgi:hypothetical protein